MIKSSKQHARQFFTHTCIIAGDKTKKLDDIIDLSFVCHHKICNRVKKTVDAQHNYHTFISPSLAIQFFLRAPLNFFSASSFFMSISFPICRKTSVMKPIIKIHRRQLFGNPLWDCKAQSSSESTSHAETWQKLRKKKVHFPHADPMEKNFHQHQFFATWDSYFLKEIILILFLSFLVARTTSLK